MSTKFRLIGLAVTVAMMSCGGKEQGAGNDEQDAELEEIATPDTLMQEEEEELVINEESSPSIDGVFNDFLFAYLHSRKLRQERTANPLRLEHRERAAEMYEEFDPEFEFSFLSGEYFTTLYGNVSQMQAEDEEEMEEDSIVNLQRINLNDGTIRNFEFLREEGRWRLEAIREATFDDDELYDFLSFYARFCTDSIFQNQSIADPLHIVLQDPDDEEESIDGIIDATQWQTFCPEVPSGIISNIRKGQYYGGQRIVLRKSGLSNGLQEVFTFVKERGNWRLSRYEN
ncbi:MAG: DUF4348 domain-containing protein [Bacteroidaceae bacterium]|nr:DUF4348 domain-containing protein [Bacteroidaceae bacterium]